MRNNFCLVTFCLVLAIANGDPIPRCLDDTQCAKKQFCGTGNLGYSICQDCLSCFVANRQDTIKCPMSYYQCGPCIDGFQLNKKQEKCNPIPGFWTSATTTMSTTLDPGGNREQETFNWVMLVIIVLAIIGLLLIVFLLLFYCYFVKKRDSDSKVDVIESNEPSAPLLHNSDSHYEAQPAENPPPYSETTNSDPDARKKTARDEIKPSAPNVTVSAHVGAEPFNQSEYRNVVQQQQQQRNDFGFSASSDIFIGQQLTPLRPASPTGSESSNNSSTTQPSNWKPESTPEPRMDVLHEVDEESEDEQQNNNGLSISGSVSIEIQEVTVEEETVDEVAVEEATVDEVAVEEATVDEVTVEEESSPNNRSNNLADTNNSSQSEFPDSMSNQISVNDSSISFNHSQDSLTGGLASSQFSAPRSSTSDSRLDSGHGSSNCIDQAGTSSRAFVSSAMSHSASLEDIIMPEFSIRLSTLRQQHGSTDSAFQPAASSVESSQNDLYRDRRNSSPADEPVDDNLPLDLRPDHKKRPLSTSFSEPEQKLARFSHS